MKNETDALDLRIRELREKRVKELRLLVAQFQTTQESLKPLNLIKSTIKKVSTSTEIKDNVLGSILGLGTGLLSKKLMVGSSHNSIKNLFGTILQFAIGNVVSKRTEGIKSKIGKFLHFYSKRRKESKKQSQNQSENIETVGLLINKKVFQN